MIGLIIALCLLPFLQIGYSYWISGHVLSALGVICFSGPENLKKLLSVALLTRIGVILGILVSTLSFPYVDNADILRAFREAICLFLIVGCMTFRVKSHPDTLGKVFTLILVIALVQLAMTIAQTFYLNRGIYFGIPQDLFVINTSTLPGALDLRYSDIRPMGTYGEPSYLSGASFAVMFGLRKAFFLDRRAAASIIIFSLVIALSRSMSGMAAVLIIWVMILKGSRYRFHVFTFALFSALAIIAFLLFSDTGASTRLLSIASGDDRSFYVRVVAPILGVPALLGQFPLGIPILKLVSKGYGLEGAFSAAELIQNGFFNILISYGVFGLPVLIHLFASSRTRANAFLVLVLMFQNGAFLTFDKFAIISIAMLLGNSIAGHRPYGRGQSSGG